MRHSFKLRHPAAKISTIPDKISTGSTKISTTPDKISTVSTKTSITSNTKYYLCVATLCMVNLV